MEVKRLFTRVDRPIVTALKSSLSERSIATIASGRPFIASSGIGREMERARVLLIQLRCTFSAYTFSSLVRKAR